MPYDPKSARLKPGEEPWLAREDPSEALREFRQPGQVDPRGHVAGEHGPAEAERTEGGGVNLAVIGNLFHFLRGVPESR